MQPSNQPSNQPPPPTTCRITTTRTKTHTPSGSLMNQYLILKKIGQGPHSRIKLARDTTTNTLVAIKKFAMYLLKKKTRPIKQADGRVTHLCIADDIIREMKIAMGLQHENVVRMLEVIDDQQNGKLYLVMEYCGNGEIASWNFKKHVFQVKEECEKRLRGMCLQMVRGLKYLHSKNIIHRDLKPQNILVDSSYCVKIIDFGRAVQLPSAQHRLKGSQGTYHFMAPEMLQQHDKSGYLGQICDIWSLGVTLYCIVFRRLPFDDELLLRLFQKIQEAEFEYPEEGGRIVPGFVKKIIDGTLVKEPKKRMTLEEIERILLEEEE